jgi:hypothetical protein
MQKNAEQRIDTELYELLRALNPDATDEWLVAAQKNLIGYFHAVVAMCLDPHRTSSAVPLTEEPPLLNIPPERQPSLEPPK